MFTKCTKLHGRDRLCVWVSHRVKSSQGPCRPNSFSTKISVVSKVLHLCAVGGVKHPNRQCSFSLWIFTKILMKIQIFKSNLQTGTVLIRCSMNRPSTSICLFQRSEFKQMQVSKAENLPSSISVSLNDSSVGARDNLKLDIVQAVNKATCVMV